MLLNTYVIADEPTPQGTPPIIHPATEILSVPLIHNTTSPTGKILNYEISPTVPMVDTLKTVTGIEDPTNKPAMTQPDHKNLTPNDPDNLKISNAFFETDLKQALQDTALAVGKVVICAPEVQGYVSCEFKDVSFEEALNLILGGSNYSFKKLPNYYLVYSQETTSPIFLDVSETRLVKINYLKAELAKKLLSGKLQEYVQSDPELKSNSLSITAPPKTMERIISDLKIIDRKPQQVMLDARFVVMESGDLFNIGVKWGWPQIKAGAFSDSSKQENSTLGDKWPWGVQMGYTPNAEFTNSLLMTLNLLAQNDQATVIANPQVMAQDGCEASISVKVEEYFEVLTRGYYTQSELEKVEAGTLLKITPNIGDNNEITMILNSETSDVVARGENNLPVVTRRLADSTVRVDNGGTVIVAGLVDTRTRLSKTKVPGLSQVPLFGQAFRDRSREETSKQVAVFITPRIIMDDQTDTEKILEKKFIEPVDEMMFKKELKISLSKKH